MTMTNGRTPAPVDDEGALDFSDKKEQRPPSNKVTIRLAYQGVPVDIELSNKAIGQVENLVKGLLANGWTAPPLPSRGGFGGRPDNRVEADRNERDEEICPIHRAKIKVYKTQDGKEFKGCPSKGTGAVGEQLNQRGYCGLRFK